MAQNVIKGQMGEEELPLSFCSIFKQFMKVLFLFLDTTVLPPEICHWYTCDVNTMHLCVERERESI